MTTHAMAFVNYRNYRTSPENKAKYSRAYWYVSKKPRVVNLVGNGGTLWVVTSRLRPKRKPVDSVDHKMTTNESQQKERVYSLAYKLVGCEPSKVRDDLKNEFGEYGVSGSFTESIHFPSNNITDVLLNLEFMPKKPIRGRDVIGLSLLNARCLSPEDIVKVEGFADKVMYGKNIFISYSNEDATYADILQNKLEEKQHSVFRDVRSIIGGDQWEPAILRALQNASVFVLLISENSARSDWVKDEVKTALNILGKPGKLQVLLPIVLSMDAWNTFPEVHHIERREWGKPNLQEFFAQVIDDLRQKRE